MYFNTCSFEATFRAKTSKDQLSSPYHEIYVWQKLSGKKLEGKDERQTFRTCAISGGI